jgi:hypothetical protein
MHKAASSPHATFMNPECCSIMKSSVFIILLLATVFAFGCDDPMRPGLGGVGGTDMTGILKPMTKVKVSFIATTLLHVDFRQGGLDPGSEQDQWAERVYLFHNFDPSYTIGWDDSVFTIRACYSIINLTTGGGLEDSRCDDQSLIRGTCGHGSPTVNDLTCFVSHLEGYAPGQPPDPDNYRLSYINLTIPKLTLEAVYDDSVSYVISDAATWRAASFSYSLDERWYSTFNKKLNVTQFDTLGAVSQPVCRLVFYAPK